MSSRTLFARAGLFTRLSLGTILASVVVSAVAEPSQLPLLSRDGWAGRPNVMFTLDDSGSMVWPYMPDSLYGSGGMGSVGASAYRTGYDPAQANEAVWTKSRFYSTSANDLIAARYRAPLVNKIYYNPEIRYVPWSFQDGSQMANSPPNAAWIEPLNTAAGTTDITRIDAGNSARWCTWTPRNCNTKTIEYAPATYFDYAGAEDDTTAQAVIANYTRVRIADSTAFVRGGSRTDCPEDAVGGPTVRNCTQAQEFQNFANWFTYYRDRMRLAIGATSTAFGAQGDGLRVGYGRINKGSGNIDGQSNQILIRGVRDFSGGDRAAFFTWLYAQFGSGSTPLRRAMGGVGDYFERSDDDGPWGEQPGTGNSNPHLECRKSYHILMSDGYWNSAQAPDPNAQANVDGNNGPAVITGPGGQSFSYSPILPYSDTYSQTLADVAMYYWYRDLRPDLTNRVRPDLQNPAFWQQLVQFTVGLGVKGSLDPETDLEPITAGTKVWPGVGTNPGKIDDMWHAAVNSKGRFLSASDPQQFAVALGQILQSISERESAEGGAAVSSITLEVNSRKYIPTYQTSKWSGDVVSKILDEDGISIADAWRASEQMPAPAARNIVIGNNDGSSVSNFTWAGLTNDHKTQIGPDASQNLVDYIRGDRTNEGTQFRSRDPLSVMGDMVNSTPLLIGGLLDEQYNFLPTGFNGKSTYRQFLLTTKKTRSPLLFIGSNDGMLHAFDEATGVEKFAYIPYSVLGKLAMPSQPSYQHKFLVDGPLVEADAFLPTRGGWRNLVVGTTGAGSQSVFALDVTDPDNIELLWEVRDGVKGIAGLGHVMAPPTVGVTKNGTWIAAFGNGYDSVGGIANLFIVDLATGQKIRKISTNEGGDNGMGGVRLVKNYDNVVVAAYAGDRKGKMWRFDLSADNATSWGLGFGGLPLYAADGGASQPIQGQPEYIEHPDGGQLVLFGTGRLYSESDLVLPDQQTIFGVWDKVSGNETTTGTQRVLPGEELAEHSFGTEFESAGTEFTTINPTPVNYSIHRGWKLDLTQEAGQRSIYSPQLVRGLVLFNTVAPTGGTGLPCDDSRSTGYNILINALTGAAPQSPTLDTNGDGVIDDGDTIVASYKTVADGVDTFMYGRGGKVSIQRAQGQTTANIEGRGVERSWRQLLNPPNAL